ncbi:MAG: TfuA-like protein [Dongiaceae bacterium]
MNVVVFTGPTLPEREARQYLEADYRPPAAIGDVYKAALSRPFAIGIVDGYYETTPSIWHKEVLWALKQGIHVYGAASMGALRAAELAGFGMTGVGKVFEDYRDGAIEDDDEVAVLHSPAEMGYLQVSEAMVNIRATLNRAAADGVIEPATANRLIAVGRAIFWKQRGYDALLAAADDVGTDVLGRLRAWLPGHKVNQKREDAIAMLQRIAADCAATNEPKQVDFDFQHTVAWDAILHRFTGGEDGGVVVDREELLDELRLTPGAFAAIRRKALLRALAGREAERRGLEPTIAQLQKTLRDFRRAAGLASPSALEAWMQEAGLTRDEFLRLMNEEARLASLEEALGGAIDRALLDELRLDGAFSHLLGRAREKQNMLAEAGLGEIGITDTGLDESALLRWYRNDSGSEGPEDAADLALALGFESRRDLLRALAREYSFRQPRKA